MERKNWETANHISDAREMRPLISSSIEQLRRQGSEIDGKLVACFRRMDIRKRSKFFFEVEREARKKWQEGEGETSFILYCRARKVQDLILESMDERFEQSLEGCWFFETAKRMASDFNQVSESLETQFEIQELEREFSGEEDAFLPKMREICAQANLRLMAQDEPVSAEPQGKEKCLTNESVPKPNSRIRLEEGKKGPKSSENSQLRTIASECLGRDESVKERKGKAKPSKKPPDKLSKKVQFPKALTRPGFPLGKENGKGWRHEEGKGERGHRRWERSKWNRERGRNEWKEAWEVGFKEKRGAFEPLRKRDSSKNDWPAPNENESIEFVGLERKNSRSFSWMKRRTKTDSFEKASEHGKLSHAAKDTAKPIPLEIGSILEFFIRSRLHLAHRRKSQVLGTRPLRSEPLGDERKAGTPFLIVWGCWIYVDVTSFI
ncbi:hypothetical protein GPALN_013473 [Globodera pallida]|nr:hypothetical protein GPALN_013473 [Globodera pallida]